jgi:hypothetical protein
MAAGSPVHIDAAVVAIGLPALSAGVLRSRGSQSQWVTNAYLLPLTVPVDDGDHLAGASG